MRKKTLGTVCVILGFAIVFLTKWLAGSEGIPLPFLGYVSAPIVSFITWLVLIILIATVNQPILKWRKAHGRDIEAEEKHEFDDADLISLRPRQPHEHSSTYHHMDHD